MKKLLLVITLLVLPWTVLSAPSRWGPAGCGPVGSPATVQSGYEWHTIDQDNIALYRDGRQIGAYNYPGKYYRPMIHGGWGEPCDPPIPVPDRVGALLSNGVDWGKLAKEERYDLAGQPISRKKVFSILSDNRLADDSEKWYLTIISRDAARRKQILEDLKTAPCLAQYVSRLHVQEYNPDDRVAQSMLAPFKLAEDSRFQLSGLAIYLQPPESKAGGSRVYPLYAYEGPEKLAENLQTVRAPNSKYHPNDNKEISGAPFAIPVPIVVLGAMGLVVLGVLILPRRN